jgi:hypothetical protein
LASLQGLSAATTYHFRIVATNKGGTSNGSDKTFVTPANSPKVTLLKPKAGSAGGGTSVAITGTELGEARSVQFGSVEAASFVVNSRSSITARTPAEPAGAVHVMVTTPAGTSPSSSASVFTFTPAITGLSPKSGPASGGTTVTVSGIGFAVGTSGTTFKFGGAAATSVNCATTTACTVVSPAHSAGKVDVRATVNKAPSPPVAADKFSYT